MSFFSSIPVRENSDDVDASWWNTIRTKLVTFFGAGINDPQTFTIADNQSSYADITGLLLDSSTYTYYEVFYTIIRSDGTNKRRERGFLYFSYDSQNGWAMNRDSGNADALNMGVDSIALSSEQAQYKSDSMGGTYAAQLTWQITRTVAAEGI